MNRNRAPTAKSVFDRLVLGLCVLLMLWLAVAVTRSVALGGDDEPPSPERSEPGAALPECSAAATQSATRRTECRTASATLQIVEGQTPLLLERAEVQLVSASVSGGTVRLRMRVRNLSGSTRTFNANGKQVYLTASGQRRNAQGRRAISPRTAETVILRVPLGDSSLGSGRGSVDVGVVPFEQLRTTIPSELGVIKTDIGGDGGVRREPATDPGRSARPSGDEGRAGTSSVPSGSEQPGNAPGLTPSPPLDGTPRE